MLAIEKKSHTYIYILILTLTKCHKSCICR